MRASVLLLAGLLLTVGIAAPVAAAPDSDPPPGFGTCHIEYQSAGTVSLGPIEQEILVPNIVCYW